MEYADSLHLPLRSARDLDKAVGSLGVLPFFKGLLQGLSVEEMADPSLWFTDEHDGPWEWKGPVIGMGHAAYGKFLADKAVYMRLDVYADFLNHRRNSVALSNAPADAIGGLSESDLLRIIEECGSVVSSELKDMLGFGRHRRRTAADLVDVLGLDTCTSNRRARSALDSMLARLQAAGRVCIEGFEYNTSASGKKYGWGLARYTTPEALYGAAALSCEGRTAPQSRARLLDIISAAAPAASLRKIHTILL